MARTFDPFELPVWSGEVPRRKHGGGRTFAKDRAVHGPQLTAQVDAVQQELGLRATEISGGINPKLLFAITVEPRGRLADEQLSSMGLRVVGRSPGQRIVVFPDEPTLAEFRRYVDEYAGTVAGHGYSFLANISEVRSLTEADRIGRRLTEHPWPKERVTSWT